ncbi:hypothetical protein LFZ31_01690, partial [Salmonella enterica subsp. enterica serovar Newport str. S09097]
MARKNSAKDDLRLRFTLCKTDKKAQDYRALLLADTPLIDVRAPIEFEQGAMPGAINLPLMMDDERGRRRHLLQTSG